MNTLKDNGCAHTPEHPEIIIEETDKTDIGALSDSIHKTRAAYRNTPSNKNRVQVSILVFAYNNLQRHTKYCIESILKYTNDIDYELVLLDNGSSDGTLEYFKSVPYAKKKVVRITENKSASYGQFIATKNLLGRYVVMIANDVYVTANWLPNMIKCAESDERIGFLATAADNISNLQSVNLTFDSLEDMHMKAAQYNVSDPRKWEERLRLMPAVAFYKRECLDIIGSLDYAFRHDFSDDDISFRVRRAGYKILCCKDVFVHHVGSSAAGSPERKIEVLKRGREIFRQKYYGVDAWEDVNNFEPLMLSLVNPEEKRNTSKPEVLGIDVMCGTPILQLKNKLRLADIFDTNLSAFVQDAKYWLDLKTICEGTVVVDRIEYLAEHFSPNSFDYILLGNPINLYNETDKILGDILSLLKIDGQLLIKFRNHFDAKTFLSSGSKDLGSSNKTVSYSDINDINELMMRNRYAIRDVRQKFHNTDDATKKAIRKALKSSHGVQNIETIFNELLTEEYALRIVGNVVHKVEPLLEKSLTFSNTPSNVETTIPRESQKEADAAAAISEKDPLFPRFQQEDAIPGLTSIVIPTSNQLDYIKRCVKGIGCHTPEAHEVIFVDNGCRGTILKWIKQAVKGKSNYRLIKAGKEAGQGECFNTGMRASSGEYIVLLQDHVSVSHRWLDSMLECLNSGGDTGIVGPMTNNPKVGIQYVPNSKDVQLDQFEKYAQAFAEKNRHRRVPSDNLDGFCMLFRRSMVEEIGGFPKSLEGEKALAFLMCVRVAGYKNVIAGDVFVFSKMITKYDKNVIFNKKLHNFSFQDASHVRKMRLIEAVQEGEILFQEEKVDEAILKIVEGVKQIADEPEIYHRLAEMLIDVARFQDALDTLHSIPEDKDKGARTLELKGYSKAGLDLYEEAMDLAHRAVSINPSSPSALNLMGMLTHHKNDIDNAELFFKKAIEADPGYGAAYTNLGSMALQTGKTDLGLELIEKGFNLSPTVPECIESYHAVVIENELYQRAEEIYSEAKALYPKSRRIVFFLIDVLIRQENFARALSRIREAIIVFGADDGILSAAKSIIQKLPEDHYENTQKTKLLSLCMIVKNEENYLPKCLYSVLPVADEIIVVDTGSTDRTRDIAEVFGAQTFDFHWNDDFSEARNLSLSKATGTWILVMDADEIISPRDHESLRKIVEKKPTQPVAYSITTRNYIKPIFVTGWTANVGEYTDEEDGTGWYPSDKVRLFTNNSRIRFEAPIHELLEPSLKRLGVKPRKCLIPVHHYGQLDWDKYLKKGRKYNVLGRKKLKEKGNDLQSLVEMAVQSAGEFGGDTEAIELWKKVLRIDPNFSKAFVNMGYCYFRLEEYRKAFVAAKRATELDPASKEAVIVYTTCQIIIGDHSSSIPILKNLLKKTPQYPMALAILVAAYCIDGRAKQAFAHMQNLIKLGFECGDYLYDLSERLAKSERIEQAICLLNYTMQSGKKSKKAQELLVSLMETQGLE